MALLAPFDRTPAGPVPPMRAPGPTAPATPAQRQATGRFLVHLLLGDGEMLRARLAELEASIDERVVAWSPAMYTTSRTALVEALLEGDDAIAGLEVSIVGEALDDATTYLEWQATGRFANAGFIDDDVLIEASGGIVQACGVLALAFAGTRVAAIRCYYDALALQRQMI